MANKLIDELRIGFARWLTAGLTPVVRVEITRPTHDGEVIFAIRAPGPLLVGDSVTVAFEERKAAHAQEKRAARAIPWVS